MWRTEICQWPGTPKCSKHGRYHLASTYTVSPSSDSSDSGSCVTCVTKTALHICVVPLLPDIIYEHMSLGVLVYEH